MDPLIISDVETVVMEMNTPAHVASNHPGKDTTMMVKDAVPPVQTAASKIKKVKKTLFKKRNKNPNFFIPFIFTGNVNCTQGSVIRLGEKCSEIQQCLKDYSYYSKVICEDGHCSEKKRVDWICRGIPNVACNE